jgi:predicted esterase
MQTVNIHQNQPLLTGGAALETASDAMILLHGRGADAQSIMELSAYFPKPGRVFLAPQAGQNRWYPQSFLAPLSENEPDLSDALIVLDRLVIDLIKHNLPPEQIFIGGFSQGACLAAEFAARFPRRYGGLLIFSGGLIGPQIVHSPVEDTWHDMPVFIGCSDVDPHIPLKRVEETAAFYALGGANVKLQITPGMAHTISLEELEAAQKMVNVTSNT